MELRLISLIGLVTFITLAWGISIRRDKFPWRTVLAGLGLQTLIAIIMVRPSVFRDWIYNNAKISADNLIYFAQQGTQLVFGPLAKRDILLNVGFDPANAMVLGITICGTIILVAVLSSLLYHLGILQRIVHAMAWIMQRVMRTSGSESLCTSANVFMGQTEAPLVIQPYLKGMTRSELMTMMVGGMATIAGGVFAVYAGMGIEAGHLLTASFMAAPTALYMSKILLPETEKSETSDGETHNVKAQTTNALDAMCQGAGDGMKLTINVLAMLIGFTAVIALFNYLLVLPQNWANVSNPITFDMILGWLNAPFAWLMGIPWGDCETIGQALGKRMVFTEFIGYLEITGARESLDPRSFTLATFAICGFANFASIAIQIGGIGSLAPERRQDLAKLGLRAMVGGILVGYTNACIAGLFL
ncbi:MAG: nucleoside transporter C-terminal domain-containing protein [Verrucomicrobiota bacterium]|nr:nucleoside transporter C-terminal domain-containing protein [Verrucomicrobiota bacterium]MEE2813643.1 nucleoside transporter C-terminal domain-containing protein [Verrucomicrobiota bacterium]